MLCRAKAPLRISFAGGGTDISPYRELYGGCVVATSIQKYCYAECGDWNPAPSAMEVAITKRLGGELRLISGLPPMSGLGGSAASCVAGIKVLQPLLSAMEIADLAYRIEREDMGVAGGYQDQLISAHGGFLYIEFGKEVTIERLSPPRGLESLLALTYMGQRQLWGPDIIRDQVEHLPKEALDEAKLLAQAIGACHNLIDFGRLLDKAWLAKRRFSPLISNPNIDAFREWALENGAIAFKLCGAGGGGYALLMEHPDYALTGRLWHALRDRGVPFEPVVFDTEGVQSCP